MQTCRKTDELIKWMNGSFDESETISIGEHIENCEACQQRLEELTSEPSIDPPSRRDNLLSRPTFTDEPHFRSMRRTLGEKVSDLTSRKPGPDNGLKNKLGDLYPRLGAETIEQNAASTLATETPTSPAYPSESTPQIEGYFIESSIGSGGFAKVFRAWDKQLERNVAIKILDRARLNPRNRHRFLREAKTASSLESPHIVRVLTSGETDDRPFIVMELIQGETLANWIERHRSQGELGEATIRQGVQFLIQVCKGVQTAHDAGLVHRDIKPGNIFLDLERNTAKLGDFGLARILELDTVTLTQGSELAGTPAYMSPEQTMPNGHVRTSSDVYSLGATLYQILTGRPPFSGPSLGILKQVIENRPDPPSRLNDSVTKNLETICLRALEKDPEARFESSISLANDLQRAIDGKPIQARPVSKLELTASWIKSHQLLTVITGLLALTLFASLLAGSSLWRTGNKNAQKAEQNKRLSVESQRHLIDSMITELNTTFSRKSKYIEMSSEDRMKTIDNVNAACHTIFSGEGIQHRDQVRELVRALASATEVHLELLKYEGARKLIAISLPLANQNFEMNDATHDDRVAMAWVFNQMGDFLASKDRHTHSQTSGSAAWTTENLPDGESADFYQQALDISNRTREDEHTLEMQFQNIYAQWNLDCLKIKLAPVANDEFDNASVLNQLKDLLEEVILVRGENRNLPFAWMSLHQRMLQFLAKQNVGQAQIELRERRADVFHAYLEQLKENGQETFWHDRTVAVNDFYTGLEYLKIGQPSLGRQLLSAAVDRLEELTIAFPKSSQFRADVAEGLIVIGNIDWVTDRSLAMKAYEAAISQFEMLLKTDSKELSIRRRIAHVYEMLAQKNQATDLVEPAAEHLANAVRHMQVVANSAYDGPFKTADFAALSRMRLGAAKAFETLGDKTTAKKYREDDTNQSPPPTADELLK